MPNIDKSLINYAVYEDAVEYVGMAEVTLPEITNLTQEITGAGIAGNVEAVILGHIESMTATFNFRTVTAAAAKLAEPRAHKLDCRVAQQVVDTKTGETKVQTVKHIMKAKPKKYAPGKLAVASTADASGEYAVTYYAIYIDGKKKTEIDPLNFIYYVNGTDYLKDVRKALGK